MVYPNIVLLDLVGPLQVFTHAHDHNTDGAGYQTHVVSQSGGPIATNTVLTVETTPLDTWLSRGKAPPLHTLVLVGGDGVYHEVNNARFVDQVRQLAHRAGRVCSVCSGALLLAAAGVLDGRRAVTHWEDCDQLARRFPGVTVEVDPIFVKDGQVWTSAGITAGIDMSLAIIEEDLGKSAAIAMARSLVTPMVRSGGQSQFSAELDRQARDGAGRFSDLHDWVVSNLDQRISIEDMARRCGMSPRNFSRRYAETMGVPPAKAIEAMRVDAARTRLVTTDDSIKMVAVDCGFGDDERMRRAFLRHINTAPSAYRKQFQTQ